MVEVRSYGAVSPSSPPRAQGLVRSRTALYITSAAAALALLAVAFVASQQQETVLEEQGSWDQGWLHRFVRGQHGGARMQSAAGTAAATSGGAYVPNQASIDRMRKVQVLTPPFSWSMKFFMMMRMVIMMVQSSKKEKRRL